MNPIELIQQHYETLTKNERIIANTIINDPKKFIRANLQETLAQLHISKAAMVRFCKKLGFSGYHEYIYELKRFLMTGDPQNHQNSCIDLVSNAYLQGIQDLQKSLNAATLQAFAQAILSSRKVRVFGFNRTGHSARQLSLRALSMNIDIEAIVDDASQMRDILKVSQPDDLLICFTASDNTGFFSQLANSLMDVTVNYAVITFRSNLSLLDQANYRFVLPSEFKAYGTFYDEQLIFFVFIEILVHEMVALEKMQ